MSSRHFYNDANTRERNRVDYFDNPTDRRIILKPVRKSFDDPRPYGLTRVTFTQIRKLPIAV